MPELFFSHSEKEAKRLSALVRQGGLRRVRQGVYTDATPEQVPRLLASRWYQVVDYLYPDALVAYRSAHELRPVDGYIVIVADIKKPAHISVGEGLTILVQPGNTGLASEAFIPGLLRSTEVRYLLENLSAGRSTAVFVKTLGNEWVEDQLCTLLQKRGETALNNLRDQARELAEPLGLEKEFQKLNKIIGALLSSQPVKGSLTGNFAIATSRQLPYDAQRADLFRSLAGYLRCFTFPSHPYTYNSSGWRNLSFFESYFSNYIEGTEFEIDEAEEIIFQKKLLVNRQADSHDVLSVFDVVNDYQEMITTPQTADELIFLIQQRHQLIMGERPEKRPGLLKQKNNKAGDTLFVEPKLLVGTLIRAFDEYLSLPEGLARALYIQFLVSECHPFDDGNGRLSRIMMNAELSAAGEFKVFVPTVHRDSYLNSLRQASRQGKFRTLCKVFYQLQCYIESLDWQDYGQLRQQLEDDCCHKLPDEGVAVFNRKIRPFTIELPIGN